MMDEEALLRRDIHKMAAEIARLRQIERVAILLHVAMHRGLLIAAEGKESSATALLDALDAVLAPPTLNPPSQPQPAFSPEWAGS